MISAKASAALRWRPTFSEKDRMVRAERGDPEKKFVVVRSVGRWSGVGEGEAGSWVSYCTGRSGKKNEKRTL